MQRFILVFLILFMCLAMNLSDGFLARLGVDADILLIAMICLVVTGLIAYRGLALLVIVVLTAVAANVQEETATAYGYDPDILVAAMVAMDFVPPIVKRL